ncbi:DUF2815 family protein [Pseudomonas fluorescens]|uniref:DUF2815 family protein n=1 Tax=Pseudomonas fluorescens TaxID=294 RepID=UPI001BB0F08B|nr:DUF2815 family protein [Pseudomonas fluorescens]
MTVLGTVLASPYLYRRNKVYYLRLRVRGVKSDSITFSLRTIDKTVATGITKDILKRLAKYHLERSSATWKQLRARLPDITQRCLAAAHGETSMAAYRTVPEKLQESAPSGLQNSGRAGRVWINKDFHFTPRGIAEPHCSIHKPDYGNPEKGFGNPRGEYKVNITCSSADAQPIIDEIVKAHEANYAALMKQFEKDGPALRAESQNGRQLQEPYEGDMPFFENDDGTVTFKIKGYASYIDTKTQESKPLVLKVVDAKGKRIENVPAISGGSELKVRFSLFPYGWSNVAGASVKLQIDSVMLIKLVETDSNGFDDVWRDEIVEGGYEVADPASDALVKALPWLASIATQTPR